MQRHVAALDAVGGERAQRGEVGGQARAADDRRQRLGVGDAEQALGEARARVRVQRAADGADRHRHLEAADEVVAVGAPDRERPVAPVGGGERVRARLDAAPVVAGRDHDRVDAVHDPLVVGGGAVGIVLGEARGGDDRRRGRPRRRARRWRARAPGCARPTRTQRRSHRLVRMRSPSGRRRGGRPARRAPRPPC